ncbi:polyamine oxidase KNAG_0M02130 [Huiozyma naganishii CBS 8797]|uniref:Amine oxidase domain-containing protein n=1 Tax=Huiozyma naganishii (strain ATCC MYA-139 / BCRC 22969 / CBS 8797 / KCTC 17520 / NBRC 10181 / NCYC 3082 / Yp74L-3) TaxID=1071383 RepID=J7SBI2_HUIN7|nr:hypothetical protein KNAG_0M02130 [Kazachstania naganishii CBS 8797]CCK73066.1 hypothetical protein KNAG_0M02130 [Kazachstania naganishii CBS 8797]
MKVVVVGAGISGLKAAATLYQRGVQECVVLEARSRIGGRLHSVTGYDGKRKYDLGASWHHDTLRNDLFFEECRISAGGAGGTAGGAAPFAFDDDFMILIDNRLGRLDRHPEMRLEIVDSEISKFADLEYHQKLGTRDTSFRDLVYKYLFEKRQFLTDNQIRYTPQLSRFLELWHGIDWRLLSARDTYFGHQGRNAFVMNFDAVVRRISSGFPQEWIHCDSPVAAISRTRDGKVQVRTQGPEGADIEADYCIVTVPQSVLQLSTETMPAEGRIQFSPPLNTRITGAFERMHFGGLGKVIFEFDRTTWSLESTKILTLAQSSSEFVQRVRSATSLEALVEDPETPQVGTCWDHPLYFVNLSKIDGTPSFMMIMQEPLTQYIESLGGDKQRVVEYFRPVLDKVLTTLGSPPLQDAMAVDHGDDVGGFAPLLKNVIVSNWTQDEFSRGAYSACHPGDDALDMIVALSDGQGPRIRFAGEHTVMDGAGCVYGAWESGKREAEFILEDANWPQ